jgi:two-component sensor histidine kinase
MRDHLTGGSDKYEAEYRILSKAGEYLWFYDIGAITKRDANGKPMMVAGIVIEITARKSAEEKIRSLYAEKELVLKEVHHRIKNNMNTITSLLSLQAKTMKDPSPIAALDDATARVRSMGMLYDKLYRSEIFNELSIKDYLSSLIDEILLNFPNNRIVKAEKNIQDIALDTKRLQSLGIIINELLTNCMKYAFKDRENGLISVSAVNAEGHVAISVQDDGAGIPETVSFDNSTGFGLQLVNALTQQLDGTVRIERENGTKIIIEFEL